MSVGDIQDQSIATGANRCLCPVKGIGFDPDGSTNRQFTVLANRRPQIFIADFRFFHFGYLVGLLVYG